MRQIYPDLWQTTAEHPLSAFPNSVCHAYLLVRDSGNILFCSTGREAVGQVDDRADHDRIHALGGVSHMLLCHWHEASRSVHTIKQRFGCSLVSHARDAAPIAHGSGVAPDVTFWDRQTLAGDIEAIPTPGHTVGSACYQYRSLHGKTYLFTGDTIWPARGSWTSVTFEDDARQSSHRASLDLLATLEPNVVIAAISPNETFQEIHPRAWRAATEMAKASLG
jgi:hydroxyacylglutathione hydrolase